MSLAYAVNTVSAHPLGLPECGTERFGMTPVQAVLYADLVAKHGGNEHQPFTVDMRATGERLSIHCGSVCVEVEQLVDRGWLRRGERLGGCIQYQFVLPVKRFARVPDVEVLRQGHRSRSRLT